jgi:hypothetical protein
MIGGMRVGTNFFLLLAAVGAIEAKEFYPNVGQLPPEVRFAAKAGGVELLAEQNGNLSLHSLSRPTPGPATLAWLGSTPGPWTPGPTAARQVRYCLSGVPAASCQTSSPTFVSVRRQNLFPRVDLELHTAGGRLEYDLVVQPGGDVEQIRFALKGHHQPWLNPAGQLIAGDIVQWSPVAFQIEDGRRIPVACQLRQHADRIFGFAITGIYNRQLPLIIDPVIESSNVVTGLEPGEDRLLGQAVGYSFGKSKRVGRADWDIFVTIGGVTTYWGGEGEERLLGFDDERTNNRLYLVGSTTSRDAFVTGALGQDTVYRGGDSDAFFLEFGGGYLREAALLGGPGMDSLHDVRRTGPDGSPSPLLIVGETTDPRWSRFQVTGQAQGGSDAIAGWFGPTTAALVVTGGPGDDSAKRLRRAGRILIGQPPAEWIVAGETTSSGFAGKATPGRDLWVSRLFPTPLQFGPPTLWGGSGDDRLTGLALLAGHGVMLTGSTSSPDLPATETTFQGGDSDGFLAWLDPVDLSPRRSRYLGGPGTDEILALHTWGNDLFLAGFTDSLTLAIPGLLPGADPSGRQDGLFIHTDPFLNPLAVYRAGSSGDDRFTSVAASEWGAVELAGWSDSRPWLAGLQAFPPSGDSTAGFNLKLRYPMVATTTVNQFDVPSLPPVLTLGRDLQLPIPVSAFGEATSDEVLIARSLDPTKLRLAGEDSVLLFRGGELVLEALAEEGEVEVLITGAIPTASPAPYPERRLRVRLAPSRAYIEQPSPGLLTLAPGEGFPLHLLVAPVLPSGAAGTPQQPRPSVTFLPQFTLSDPTTILIDTPEFTSVGPGRFRVPLRALRAGVSTLTLNATGIPAAPNQQLPIRIATSSPARSAWSFRAAVLLDHFSNSNVSLAAGEQLRFTSADPASVGLAVNGAAPSGSVHLTAPGLHQLSISALRVGSPVLVRVEGQWQGSAVNEQLEVLPLPYSLQVSSFSGRLVAGLAGHLILRAAPQRNPSPEYVLNYQQIRPGSPLSNLQVRFSTPGVVMPLARGESADSIVFRFQAGQPGATTVELEGAVLPEPLTVEVVSAYIDYGAEVRIPTLTTVNLVTSNYRLSPGSERQVRVRVSEPALFSLTWNGRSAPEHTIDLSNFSALQIESKGPPDRNGSLLISAPGMSEFALPLRVFPRVMVPFAQRLRLNFAPQEPAIRGSLEYSTTHFNPDEPPRPIFTIAQRVINAPPQTFRVRAVPAGICDFPDQVTSGQFSLTVPFTCAQEGQFTVTLEADGWSAYQARFPVQITTYRPPLPPLFSGIKLALAAGTQAELFLPNNARRFSGTLTSSDPARVKLASSPLQPGQASLANANLATVYVQAFSGEGLVWINAESPDGAQEQIPVYLYPATIAVRANERGAGSEHRIPADQPSLAATAAPFAIDPGSGRLLPTPYALALRAGTDPFFLKSASTDESVALPMPPDPLFSEGDTGRPLTFQIKQKGSSELSVEQPPGFVTSPHARLRLTVAERTLEMTAGPLAPLLQTQATVVARTLNSFGHSTPSVTATVTSLDPSKLLLSANRERLGLASVNLPLSAPVFLQVLSAARPGERLSVRLSAPGFADSTVEFAVGPALLAWESNLAPLELDPGVERTVAIRYAPEDPRLPGRMASSWSGGPLPGFSPSVALRIVDRDLVALATATASINANSFALVSLRGLRPGNTELILTGPEGIVNRAERTAIRVNRWRFLSSSLANPGAPYHGLWTPFVIQNPRDELTAVTLTSVGPTPLGFSTVTTAPPSSALQVTLAPRERVTIFHTPMGPGNTTRFSLSAPDFVDETIWSYPRPASLAFEGASPFSLALANRTATIAVQLPAPLALPGQAVEVRSSAPGIVRVLTSPQSFARGQSRLLVTVEMLAPGTAVLTALPSPDASVPAETALQSAALSLVVR